MSWSVYCILYQVLCVEIWDLKLFFFISNFRLFAQASRVFWWNKIIVIMYWPYVSWWKTKWWSTVNNINSHHHHHVVLVARISLTLSRHFSLSFIASGRSSGQHPISSHSCWMYVRTGRPAFAWPCVGVHKSTSLLSSSLLLQQCPACLVCLTWIVFVIGGRWAVQLVSCGVLPSGLVEDCSQHSCVIAI